MACLVPVWTLGNSYWSAIGPAAHFNSRSNSMSELGLGATWILEPGRTILADLPLEI
jgi:hypothetical protein